jgi:DNA-directed RNA polymerase subunit delta
MAESMLDVAKEILIKSGKPMAFMDLVDQVSAKLGFSEEEKKAKMAQFYTNLSLDGSTFVVLSDNCWDLRERVPLSQIHIDMNDAYNDKIDEDEESEEDETKSSELGEEEGGNSEDTYDDNDDTAGEEEMAEKAKKELGV